MMKYLKVLCVFSHSKSTKKNPKNTIKTIQEITKEINIIKQKK